jgi:hypothetical protein
MPPAHQCLEADELAVDAHLRLIVQYELLRDAVPQVILERAALAQRRIGIAIEESHRAASVDLGAVQGGVGIRRQRGRIAAVGWKYRDADAHAGRDQLAAGSDSAVDRVLDPSGQRFRARRLRPLADQGEFVAPAAGQIGAGCLLPQAISNLAQDRVAARLP